MSTEEHVANITDRYPDEIGCEDPYYSCRNTDHPRATKSDGSIDESSCRLPQDDGTMVGSVQELRDVVVGRKIVKAEKRQLTDADIAALKAADQYYWSRGGDALILELDNGRAVVVVDSFDSCAHTTLDKFLYNPAGVDHMILGVGTEDGFDTWHIYADFGDVVKLDVSWSCGNPFYYGYGFEIRVIPITLEGEVIEDVPQLPGARLAIEP